MGTIFFWNISLLKQVLFILSIWIQATKTQMTDNYLLKYTSQKTFVYNIYWDIKNKRKKPFYKVICWRMRMLWAFSFLKYLVEIENKHVYNGIFFNKKDYSQVELIKKKSFCSWLYTKRWLFQTQSPNFVFLIIPNPIHGFIWNSMVAAIAQSVNFRFRAPFQ